MTKAVAKKDDQWTPEQVELIKNVVAPGCTDDELKLYLYTAGRTGLDPLTKQIYCIKRGGKMTIQTGIDGYRAIAVRTGELAGIDDAAFDNETGKYPGKASVTVYRMVQGQRVPFSASARWMEYCQQFNGVPGGQWAKMPYLMLAKCAEALALRKAFPNDLSGIYTSEEMGQADNQVQEPVRFGVAGVIVDNQTVEERKQIIERINLLEVEQRKKIVEHLRRLGQNVTDADSIKLAIKALTSLESSEANYRDIIDRLAALTMDAVDAEEPKKRTVAIER
jgi:phage recombination protein Bet